MHERLLIAGSGGQGVIVLGKLLAAAAVNHVPHVTFFPSYGVEVRGGTSNCQVVLSSREIASPVSEQFDSVIILNRASAEKFLPQLDPDGLAVVNLQGDDPDSPGALTIRATEMANELGNVRAANFILLGVYLARKPLVPLDDVEAGMRNIFAHKNPKVLALNIQALHTGLSYASEGKSGPAR